MYNSSVFIEFELIFMQRIDESRRGEANNS